MAIQTKFCTQCGVSLDADSNFCPGCGRSLRKAVAAKVTISPFSSLLILAVMAFLIWVFFQIGRSHVSSDAPLLPPGHAQQQMR